jgi:glycosyltransferase involved in cell wall biosynthesis
MIKKINIIMPSYNCGKYLDHSVLSVFSQITKHNIVLLISNDCSTDNTEDVLSRLKATFIRDNFEIKVFNQTTNLGEVNNTKFLLDNCDGDYIAYIDADDFWITPNKLECQIDFLENNSDYSMCFTGYLEYHDGEFIPTANGQYWLSPPMHLDVENPITPDMFISANPVSSSSRVFRNYKNLIKDYFIDFPYSDWPLNFEISLLGNIKYLRFASYCYRKHNTSLTSKLKMDNNENLDIFYKRVNILKERLHTWKNSTYQN